MAVGAAATGSRPVAEIMYVDFIGLAMEPIVNQAAKLRYMFGGKAKRAAGASAPRRAPAAATPPSTARAWKRGSATSRA